MELFIKIRASEEALTTGEKFQWVVGMTGWGFSPSMVAWTASHDIQGGQAVL